MGASLTTLEVLRGRAIALYPRVFIGDRQVPVRSWAVIAGEAGDAVATSGSGAVPFRTSWRRLAPPGGEFRVVFRINVETESGYRTTDASLAVVVRSPALER